MKLLSPLLRGALAVATVVFFCSQIRALAGLETPRHANAPRMAVLTGDPSVSGLMPNSADTYGELNSFIASAPAGSSAFLARMKSLGDVTAVDGYSLLIFVNFGKTNGFSNPALGPDFDSQVLPCFDQPVGGGTNQQPTVLARLTDGQVYVSAAPDNGSGVFIFKLDGQRYSGRIGIGDVRYNLNPASLPLPACYGVTTYASSFSYDGVAEILGDAGVGHLADYPTIWHQGIPTYLDQSLPSLAHHPMTLNSYMGTTLIGGYRDATVDGFTNSIPQPVIWVGEAGPEKDIFSTNVEEVDFVGGAVLWSDVSTGADGSLIAAFGGYLVQADGTEQAAFWDGTGGPTTAPLPYLQLGGSRSVASYHFTSVGYLDDSGTEEPVIWPNTKSANLLPSPGSPGSYLGGRAVGIGSQFIAGWLAFGDPKTHHATIWAGDGTTPRDINPVGFKSSELIATAGNYLVGVGVDIGGFEHALLWQGDNLNNPMDLGPLVASDPLSDLNASSVRPTSVDDSGNITVAFGVEPGATVFYLRRQGASIGDVFPAKSGKTNLLVTAKLAPQCDPVSAYFVCYQNGIQIAVSDTQTIPAGTNVVNVTNTISGLATASVYLVQLRTEASVLSFGPVSFLNTQPANLPPSGATNYTFTQGVPLQIAFADLLAIAVDPEGDPIMFNDPMDPFHSEAGEFFQVMPGDLGFTYTPMAGVTEDRIEIPVFDSHGAEGMIEITLTQFVAPPPALQSSLSADGGTINLGVMGTAGVTYVLQASTSLTTSIQWSDVQSQVAGPDGSASFTDAIMANPSRFYRVIVR